MCYCSCGNGEFPYNSQQVGGFRCFHRTSLVFDCLPCVGRNPTTGFFIKGLCLDLVHRLDLQKILVLFHVLEALALVLQNQ